MRPPMDPRDFCRAGPALLRAEVVEVETLERPWEALEAVFCAASLACVAPWEAASDAEEACRTAPRRSSSRDG